MTPSALLLPTTARMPNWLLHETVRSILAEATSSKVKQLEKISLCYSAADTGAAQRKALINMEVEG